MSHEHAGCRKGHEAGIHEDQPANEIFDIELQERGRKEYLPGVS